MTCLLLALGLLVFILAVADGTPLDFLIQDHLWNPVTGSWLLPRDGGAIRLLLYRLPKILAVLAGLGAIAVTLAPRRGRWRAWRPAAMGLALSLVLVPASVRLGKVLTGVRCPYELTRYGGTHVHRGIIESTAEGRGAKGGRGFPGAHATCGFSFLVLAFLAPGASARRRALWGALVLGGICSAYQMACGAHFLTHNLFTLVWAWACALLIAHGVRRFRPKK